MWLRTAGLSPEILAPSLWCVDKGWSFYLVEVHPSTWQRTRGKFLCDSCIYPLLYPTGYAWRKAVIINLTHPRASSLVRSKNAGRHWEDVCAEARGHSLPSIISMEVARYTAQRKWSQIIITRVDFVGQIVTRKKRCLRTGMHMERRQDTDGPKVNFGPRRREWRSKRSIKRCQGVRGRQKTYPTGLVCHTHVKLVKMVAEKTLVNLNSRESTKYMGQLGRAQQLGVWVLYELRHPPLASANRRRKAKPSLHPSPRLGFLLILAICSSQPNKNVPQ